MAEQISHPERKQQIKALLQESLVKLLHKRPEQPLEQLLLQSNISAAIIDKNIVTGIVRHATEKEEEDRVVSYQAIEACKFKFEIDATKQITSCLVRDRSGLNCWDESTLLPIDCVFALTPFDSNILAISSVRVIIFSPIFSLTSSRNTR